MLTPTVPEGSTCRLLYTGAVGTAGVDSVISIDLVGSGETPLVSEALRTDPEFRDNWRVFVQQQEAGGISAVDPAIDFLPAAPATPTTMTLVLTSATADDVLALEAVFTPTSVR